MGSAPLACFRETSYISSKLLVVETSNFKDFPDRAPAQSNARTLPAVLYIIYVT